MEVRLNPDLQAKLARLAAQQGRDNESLVVEAQGAPGVGFTPGGFEGVSPPAFRRYVGAGLQTGPS